MVTFSSIDAFGYPTCLTEICIDYQNDSKDTLS